MRTTPLLLLVALTASRALSQSPTEAGIRKAVERYVTAFNAADADAAAATYTPDGSHTYALGFTHHGRAEIARGLRESLAGPLKGKKLSITSLNVRSVAPSVAIEEEAFSLENLSSPSGPPIPSIKGLCLAVYQRQGEEWLAAAVQCMVPPPTQEAK